MLNTKTAREIIFKGAERNAINNDGYRPVDLVEEYIQDKEMKKDLKKLLGPQPKYWPCFQIKQPMQKLEKSFYTMKYYMGMIFSTFLLLVVLIMPY